VDVRVVAATNKNLTEEVREGRFRDDLYYRLNVIEINIPPLRSRREDIPLLADHLIERISHEVGKNINDISEGALRVLLDYDWPGNVRELENALERAIVTCRNPVLSEDDFTFLSAAIHPHKSWTIPPGMTLQQLEKQAIITTLDRTQGNVKEAAGLLGIDRSTLYEKLKRYEIERAGAVIK
jgi:DNA-binding NtrC family response regulator